MSRQTQHEVEVNFVATKMAIVATEVEKNYKKNIVTQKTYVATYATENGRDMRLAMTSLS